MIKMVVLIDIQIFRLIHFSKYYPTGVNNIQTVFFLRFEKDKWANN